MLDIKLIRENVDIVRKRLASRNASEEKFVDEVLSLDDQRRKLLAEVEQLKLRRATSHKRIQTRLHSFRCPETICQFAMN